MLNETYLLVKDIPNSIYRIRSDGSIQNRITKHLLKSTSNKKNYRQVTIFIKRKRLTTCVHILVAKFFIGERPNSLEINHKDTNKQNNAVENLEYLTQQENMNHAVKHGLKARGINTGSVKLKEADVIYIFKSQKLHRVLAKKFGVHENTISGIKNRKKWKWLTNNL